MGATTTNRVRGGSFLALSIGAATCVALWGLGAFEAEAAKAKPFNVRKKIRPAADADFMPRDPAREQLGRALFHDKELSGNRNISCATCHSAVIATTDGLSINIGTGGHGTGILRDAGTFPPGPTDPVERGQRNMPPLFNLGHDEFTVMFHDGRIAVDPSHPSGFLSPAGDDLPAGFDTLLEAISIFAFTEVQEMTGRPGTNELADAAVTSPFAGVWNGIVARIRAMDAYHPLFFTAFPELQGNSANITIVHVGKAIGSYQAAAFRTTDSAFDRYLAGDNRGLSPAQKRGMSLFYGKAKCGTCHSGTFQTDHGFHAIAMPQIGPGFLGAGVQGREDFGREGVTKDSADRYKFRTPPLRNVALTGPWGHDGAFATLEGVVRHHLDPVGSLRSYDASQRILPSRPDLDALDLVVMNDSGAVDAIAARNEITSPPRLSEKDVADIIDFLHALTDPRAADLRKDIPRSVPSGLPLAD